MRTYTVTEYEMEDYDNFRENVTLEEVIEELSYIARGWLPDYNYTGSEDDFKNFKNQMIIEKAIDFLKEYQKER